MNFYLARIATLITQSMEGPHLHRIPRGRPKLAGGELGLNNHYAARTGTRASDAFVPTDSCWRDIPQRDTPPGHAPTRRRMRPTQAPRLKRCERAELALACRGPQ